MNRPLRVKRLNGIQQPQDPGHRLARAHRRVSKLALERPPWHLLGYRYRGTRCCDDTRRQLSRLDIGKDIDQAGQMPMLNASRRGERRHSRRIDQGQYHSSPAPRFDGEPARRASMRFELALERVTSSEQGRRSGHPWTDARPKRT
jgi:hypothetical protein